MINENTKENKKIIENNKMDEDLDFEKEINILNVKFREVKEKVSILRKSNKDTYIPCLRLISYKAKINLAKTTKTKKDLNIAKQILFDTEKELLEIENENIENIKNEIDAGAKKLIKEADI